MRLTRLLPCLFALSLFAVPAIAATETLAGSAWVMAGAGKRAPAISFAADGKVAGTGGCNRFFGGYEQKGDKLTFSPLGSTRMACPPDVMKKEQAFFEMLKAVRSAGVEGAKLVLRDGAGKELARLSRRH